MTPRIRWYNRAAAWLFGLIGDPLMNLAVPVWAAEAEAEYEERRAGEECIACRELGIEQEDDGALPF